MTPWTPLKKGLSLGLGSPGGQDGTRIVCAMLSCCFLAVNASLRSLPHNGRHWSHISLLFGKSNETWQNGPLSCREFFESCIYMATHRKVGKWSYDASLALSMPSFSHDSMGTKKCHNRVNSCGIHLRSKSHVFIKKCTFSLYQVMIVADLLKRRTSSCAGQTFARFQ